MCEYKYKLKMSVTFKLMRESSHNVDLMLLSLSKYQHFTVYEIFIFYLFVCFMASVATLEH